jgi:hypothetical protein
MCELVAVPRTPAPTVVTPWTPLPPPELASLPYTPDWPFAWFSP